jgi:hypothetical protein
VDNVLDVVQGGLVEVAEVELRRVTGRVPLGLTVYYWLYLSGLHVAARGFGVLDADPSQGAMRGPIVGDMIKFFPLGYWVTWDEPSGFYPRLPQLISDRSCGIDAEEVASIQLRDVPPLGWPEHPGSWGLNMFNEEMSFVAYPRRRRRKPGRR